MSQQPRTRAEAIELGLKWYVPTTPCPKGHLAKRNLSNSECRACVNERASRQRAAGDPRWSKHDAARWAKDPEGNRAKARASRARNVEKRRAYDAARYHGNEERKAAQKAQALRWGRNNPGKRNHITAKRKSWIKQATPPWVGPEMMAEIRAIYLEARQRVGHHVDHIDPLRAKDSCGLHVPWNLQILPALDNMRKGNRREA